MQHDIQPDLISAWQSGSLDAARQIVSMHQPEAINVAYLLTGERDAAVALAETAFLRLFEVSSKGDPDIDPRITLLNLIGQSFLRGDYKERERPDSGGLLVGPAPARFQVDDRRTLLLAALSRLEQRERAILILRDFSGLDTSEMTRLQERRGEPLVAPMETARQRVRQSVDIPAGDPLRPAFVEAIFNAPRSDIWARVEDEVAAIQSRHRNQSRLISLGIVGVVLVLLVGGMIALLSGGGDEGSGRAGADVPAFPTRSSLPAGPTVGQSIDMEPTPTPEPARAISGNVPSWLLLETLNQQVDAPVARSLTVYDPNIGATRRLPSNSPLQLAAGADDIRYSPDGYQMVLFREQLRGDTMHYYLTSYSTDNIARQWESEILTLDETPDRPLTTSSNVPVRLTSAVTSDRVYAAFLTTDHQPRLEIQSFFRRNGMPRGSVEIDLPLQTPDTRVFRGNIMLHVPVQGDRIYLIVEAFGDSVDEWRAALMTFSRSDLTLISERSISADPNQGYWLWASQMVADGTALYGLNESRVSGQVRVQFLDLESSEISTLTLPFTVAPNRIESVLSIPSHDGQFLYVLDRNGAQVVVVDLLEREIVRRFPLDRSDEIRQLGLGQDDQIFGSGAQFSADGEWLFIASWDHDGTSDLRRQQGIWVVDTGLWQLRSFIPVGGLIDGIFLSPAENAIYAQVWLDPYGAARRELVKIVTDSQPSVVERGALPDNGTNYSAVHSPTFLYRGQFGAGPAIDGVPLRDRDTFSTLPRLEVVVPDQVMSVGQNAPIEVHIVDPVSGEPLAGSRPDVRFDPGTGITATLRQDGQPSQLVVLVEGESGIYSGTVNLPASGEWSVDVSLTGSLGTTTLRDRIGIVTVTPALVGSDGRRYTFHLATIPDVPYAREETVIHLQVLDVTGMRPLPEDVTIEIVDGTQSAGGELLLPDRIDVRLTPAASGMLTARLSRVEHGTYQGTVSFWSTGSWQAVIEFTPDGGNPFTLPATAIMVSGT